MIFWFIGLSLWTVWFVFHDPAVDLRMVMIGAVVPNLLRVPWLYTPLHSVVVVAVLMAIVMLLTIHRRQIRRRVIFVVFGMFLSLLFDAAWTNTDVFWWPLSGAELISNLHPDRTLATLVFQELTGLALAAAFLYRMRVFDDGNLTYLLRTGRLRVNAGPSPLRRKPGRFST
jgi:hypothetical protein